MIKPDIEKAINLQIQQEFTAGYQYLGMAAYFESENLGGFAKWCQAQYEEELQHALRLFNYVLDRGGCPELPAISAARTSYGSPQEVFRTALELEKENTRSIDDLYEKASRLHDHATISHLQWFVDEQVEEEKLIGEILSLVERAGTEGQAILYLNDKLAERKSGMHPSN